ncbi:MAG: right-handed parallel beta-helix repeat-containing protein [Opitutales bacterium]|nr:right-handed parallel beta-helix repeat-containing protein [Opitutales bacterium]
MKSLTRTLVSATALGLTAALGAGPSPYHGGLKIESFNNPAFNSMGNNITVPWVDGETVAGWYSNASEITYGWSGAVSAGRLYGFRYDSSGNSEPVAGSLGVKTTDTTGPIHFAKAYVNETDEVIESFSIRFDAFVGNFNVDEDMPDKLTFSYKVGGGFEDGDYTPVPELTYETEGGTGQDVPIAGTVEGLSATVEGLSWAPGEVLWLRWTDHHDETYGGVAMGIDHIHFSTDAAKAEFVYDWEFDEPAEMVVYHVDNQHPDASDANSGTEEAPLLTIQRAVERAGLDTRTGKGSHIRIHPGVYREKLDITNRPGNHLLIIEAVEPGTVTISGSDIFDQWEPVSGEDNVYSHHWPYKFGWESNPWPGDLALRYPEGTRRELLFMNKEPLVQVIREDELAERTYIVDEANERILLYASIGVDPNEALTEVSVRPQELYGEFSKLIRVFRVNNVRLSGLRVEHAAAASLANDSAIAIRGSSNIIIEDLEVIYNNGTGLSISNQGDTPAENVIVRNTVTNFNGALGMDGGGVHNILLENGEVSYNNWRGALWGATGWAPCGFKFAYYNGMIMRDYVATQNHATGGWMDDGNEHILFERFYSVNNFRAGLSLEANWGPIVVRDSIMYGNTVGINGFDNSGVRVENSYIFDNSTGQVRMAGSTSLSQAELDQIEEGWRRGRQARRHIPYDWHLENNFIGVTEARGQQYFYSLSVRGGTMTDENGEPRYKDFPDTFVSLNNAYAHPSGESHRGFPDLLGTGIDYPEWLTVFNVTEPNEFVTQTSAETFRDEALDLVGIPLTWFTGAVSTAPVVTVEAIHPLAFEEGAVPGVFRFRRAEGDTSIPLIITFVRGGDAEAGVDYEDPGTTVQIEADEDYVDLPIIPVADGVPEFVETVTVTIDPDLDGGYRLANPRSATLYIVDADSIDPPSVHTAFGASSAGGSVSVQFQNPSAETLELVWDDLGKDYSWRDNRHIDGPSFAWNEIGSSGNNVSFDWITTNRDGLSNAIPLGFDFPFYGQRFSEVYVHSNGFVTFTPLEDSAFGYANHVALPTEASQATANMIAGFWSNLTLVAESSVRTQAGDGYFIIQYKELNRWPAFTTQRVSFQIILHESGAIDLIYNQNSYTSAFHSAGVMGPSPEYGFSLSYNDGYIRPGRAIRIETPAVWMNLAGETLDLAGNAQSSIDLGFFPDQVAEGVYETLIEFRKEGETVPRYILPVSVSVGDLILDGARTGNRVESPWFGTLNDTHSPWLYSETHGWVYLYDSASTNLLFWKPAEGWMWTHRKFYPAAWSFDAADWVTD